MSEGPQVVCIGHAAQDTSVRVASFPAEDSKCEARGLQECGGGPAANAAYLLARWGVPVAYAGTVGEDLAGQAHRAELSAAGVDTSLLELRAGHPTPRSFIVVSEGTGSRTIITHKAAAGPWQGSFPAEWRPRVLLFDGHELSGSLSAMAAYPKAVSILDAGSWREGTAELAGRVDHLAASERFARQATGLEDIRSEAVREEAVAMLRSRFASQTTLVTLGADGAAGDDGSGFRMVPAFPVTAVDTTGAGDFFHGALAFAFLRGMTFWDGVVLASMAGALSVQQSGGRPSCPSLAEVQENLWRSSP